MNEERFAYRIRQGLNHGLRDISPSVSRRLEAARHHALEHQKQSARQSSLVSANGAPMDHIDFRLGDRARQALAIGALLVGMLIAVYWQGHQYVDDLADVDSALLSDSMPPDAFLDKGFAAWLNSSSED